MKNFILLIFVILTGLAVYFAIPAKKEYIPVPSAPATSTEACNQQNSCEPETIIKEVPKVITKEIIKEVIKEIPKEIVKERIIYQTSDQDCRIELSTCKTLQADVFNLYTEADKSVKSYMATTTELKTAYKELYNRYESLLILTKNMNTQYLFSYPLTEQLVSYYDFLNATSTWKFVR